MKKLDVEAARALTRSWPQFTPSPGGGFTAILLPYGMTNYATDLRKHLLDAIEEIERWRASYPGVYR